MRYCYLVYANADPIVYAVYSNKKAAIKYASYLIKYREKWAEDRDYTFDYYHFFYEDCEERRKDTEFEIFKEKTIFSACLKILDKNGKETYDNGCIVKVIRKPILSKFKE